MTAPRCPVCGAEADPESLLEPTHIEAVEAEALAIAASLRGHATPEALLGAVEASPLLETPLGVLLALTEADPEYGDVRTVATQVLLRHTTAALRTDGVAFDWRTA